MVLVHVEVVACKDVSTSASVNTVQIHASLGCFSVGNDLFVPCNVLGFKPHFHGSRSVRDLANMRCVGASKSRYFTVEHIPKGRLGPGQIGVYISVNVPPHPIIA